MLGYLRMLFDNKVSLVTVVTRFMPYVVGYIWAFLRHESKDGGFSG